MDAANGLSAERNLIFQKIHAIGDICSHLPINLKIGKIKIEGRKRTMNEVKKPKKPLIFYYLMVLLAMMLFNWAPKCVEFRKKFSLRKLLQGLRANNKTTNTKEAE